MNSELADTFRLVALDMGGHGLSLVWSYLYAIAALAGPARWMTFVSRKPT